MGILANLEDLFKHEEDDGIVGVTGFKPEENTKGIEVTEATPEDLAEAEKKLTQKLVGEMDPMTDVWWDADKAA